MPAGSSKKRERQYEHVKESAERRGESTPRAKEIAARTVNKDRARAGKTDTASRTSTRDKSSSQRGVEGRSKMNKQELQKAVDAKK